jgi:hypothetical protein
MSLTKEKEKQAMDVMKHLKDLIISSEKFGHNAFQSEVWSLTEWFLLLAEGHDVTPMYTTDKVWLELKAKLIKKVEDIEKSLKKDGKS